MPAARAQDWTAPARELVGQLRQQIPPPARLAWSVQNRSTLSEDDLGPIRRAISSELRSAGYRPGQPSVAVAQVRITISENFQTYLWIVQVQHEEANSVMMVTVPLRQLTSAPPRNASSLAISRKLLLTREEPILDLAMIPAPGLAAPRLLVLGPASLAVYEVPGAAWQVVQTVPLVAASGLPRDMRGRPPPRREARRANRPARGPEWEPPNALQRPCVNRGRRGEHTRFVGAGLSPGGIRGYRRR